MIIHCTKKLAARLPFVSSEPLTEACLLGSWHGNLYTIDRRNCVMFCHDLTRFTLFAPGLIKRDFANLDFWFRDLFANTMLKLGYEIALIEKALSLVDNLRFDTACDRSVQGTLRSAKVQDLDGWLMRVPDVMQLPMYSVSASLSYRPVRIKGMRASECLWPEQAMHEHIRQISRDA